MRRRPLTLMPRPAALCASLLALFALAPSAASAMQARLYAGSLGAATNPAPFPANPLPLLAPRYVAVDESSGDFYVSDGGLVAGKVVTDTEKFDPEGNLVLVIGKHVDKTKAEELEEPGNPHGVTEAEADVCTVASGDVCQHGENAFDKHQTPLEEPVFLAVDNSNGPSRGDLYVSNDVPTSGNQSPGLVEKFSPSGQPIESWGDTQPTPNGLLDGSTVTKPPHEVEGPFTSIVGITVDPAGNLWVSTKAGGNAGEIPNQDFEFNQGGGFLAGINANEHLGDGVVPAGELALDAEGSLYFVTGGLHAAKFDSTGNEIGIIAPSRAEVEAGGYFTPDGGLAIDAASGELYLSGGEGPTSGRIGVVKRYGPSCHPAVVEGSVPPGCEPEGAFGAGLLSARPGGIAIDAATADKPLYVVDKEHVAVFALQTVPDVHTAPPAGPTAGPTAGSATLTGTVNPSGVELNVGATGCRFEWAEAGHSYEHTEPCEQSAAQIGIEDKEVEVTAHVSGLQAGHSYHYRLVASNENDENALVHQPEHGEDFSFGPPIIASASALSVSSTGAELQAEVGPNGAATRVRIEYGTEAGVYGHSTAEEALGNGDGAETASFEVSGLAPATTYHYRAVAESALGEGPEAVLGPDLSFTTQAAAPFALPDNRGWEIVSPPDKHGAALQPLTYIGATQAAASGDAVTYLATAATEASPAGNNDQTQVLSGRGESGWSSHDLNAPHRVPAGTPLGESGEYRAFSADLSRSILQPGGAFEPALSPQATEQTAFLREDFPAGQPTAFCGSSCYTPLVTAANDTASPFAPFGEEGQCGPPSGTFFVCGPKFEGATPDFSHIVLGSTIPLTAGSEGGMYEWSAGALAPVNILPNGHPTPAGVKVTPGPANGFESGFAHGAISADGSRVVWQQGEGTNAKLYLRDMARGQTVQLDAKEAGCGSACQAGGGQFLFANPEGTRVFLTDVKRLTAGSGAEAEAGEADLYECAISESEAGKLECSLTDLTPKAGSERAAVQGNLLGASADGSYLYFVANGVLAHNTVENGAGPETAQPGDCNFDKSGFDAAQRCNLYLLHAGATTFIATLSGADSGDMFGGETGTSTRVSANGRWLAFMSQRSLTGYDNRDAVSGAPDEEVFLYHAPAAGGAGSLVCASCDPSGARPHGEKYRSIEIGESGIAGNGKLWPPTQWIAANLPGSVGFDHLHQPRDLSGGGRLFFDSSDALLPADSNGTEDVYQYEPPSSAEEHPAEDGCATSSPTYSSASAGCVDLISSGASPEESAFLDASESGNDVFFLTSSQLTRRDTDTARDVYDARVGGGEAAPAKPVECEGDGCQQPASPPPPPTPGTSPPRAPENEAPKPRKPHHRKHHKHKKRHRRSTGKKGRASR